MLTERQYQELEHGAYGLTQRDVPLSEYTTFHIGGTCDLLIEPTSEKELIRLIRYLYAENIPYYLLGKGSNILVKDGGFRGVIVHLGRRYADCTIDGTTVCAQAGISLKDVAEKSFRARLTGLEPLSGIPGTLGGAVYMNAGAYNAEICEWITSVRLIDHAGMIHEKSAEEMEFSYRNSLAQKEKMIVSQVVMELKTGDMEQILAAYTDYSERRAAKQPLEKYSAGSTFKRPVGGYASKLIDDAKLRGYRHGGAAVSEKHCGFLINENQASAKEMLELIAHVQQVVAQKFSIHLEPEVRIIGED